MTNQELAKIAISNENTPELGQYWQKRYEKFLKNNVFILSEKTVALLEQKEPVDSPATAYGYLNLPIFLGKNKIVDEVMLQNCIETAIRFLDSVLDSISFTSEAKQLINQNRKIGLGIANFEEYLSNREASSKVEEIDYIGEIISSSSYRASEALAEEKGPCGNWNNLAFIIRPKSFEYWYNSKTGEVKSGLDIAEEFTSTNLLSSNFEIIPRRNSHILLYPNDQKWQIWSDRDDNSIITTNLSNQTPNEDTPIISTGQDDDNDYMPSFEQEISKNESLNQSNIEDKGSKPNTDNDDLQVKSSLDQFTNPPPIEDLPLINPISTLQQKISKWFAVDSNSDYQTTETKNAVDLSKNDQEIEKTNNDLPIPKVKKIQPEQEPQIVTQVKEIEVIKEVPVEVVKEVEIIKEVPVVVIKEVEVVKEINKPIFVQIVVLSSEGTKVLVDKNNQLPILQCSFEKDVESEIIEKMNQKFGAQIDFMEISSVELFENQIYVVYQAKIIEIESNLPNLHFDFIEALKHEQDTVAYSKSIDRVNRWQQSSKIKAQKLLKEYNQNIQAQANESESKIINQKNLFIEELQIRIKKLIDENTEIENQKNQQIEKLSNDLETEKIKSRTIINKTVILQPSSQPIKVVEESKNETNYDDQVTLVRNDDLMFDLNSKDFATTQSIPTININTNNNSMPQNQDISSAIDNNQDNFRISRDKMFMPTLEIETKLGVPVIINNSNNDDDVVPEKPHADISSNPKDSSHAANVLLKLKRLTR